MRGHTNSDGDVVLIPSNVCVEEAGSFHFRSHLTPGQDDSYTELSLVPCTIAASAPSRHFSRGPWKYIYQQIYKDDFIESSTNQFLSDRRYRLACKMDRHRHICRVIKQRAVDAAPDVPANPWIMDPLHHPLCEYELKEGEKLIQKALRPAS